MKDAKRPKRIAAIVITILFIFITATTVALNTLAADYFQIIDQVLFRGKIEQKDPVPGDSSDSYDLAAIEALGEEIGAEGYVLLKNNDCLPIDTSGGTVKVNVLGIQYLSFVYGGAGSGQVNSDGAVSLFDSLEASGFVYNTQLHELNDSYAEKNGLKDKVSTDSIDLGNVTDKVAEIPISEYEGGDFESFKTNESIALIVYARRGAEEADLEEASLSLNDEEKALLKYARENFDKVIVIVNSSNVMELGDEYINVENCADAVIHVGNPGLRDLNALGKIMNGTVNPSGRTVDTWAYDISSAPAVLNSGVVYSYTNTNDRQNFTTYSEGIYVGYRWYTTAHEEGVIDYSAAVRYPFGYGLSYTSFEWEMSEIIENEGDNSLSVTVKVTNVGDLSGKDVVELYYTAPYYEQERIEKSHLVLAGFAKTRELAPGESDEVKITWKRSDMASYDYLIEKCWVLSAGDYIIRAMRSSAPWHEVSQKIYSVPERELIRSDDTTGAEVTNRFDFANGKIEYLSRAGDFANYDLAIRPGGGLDGTELPQNDLEMLDPNWGVDNNSYIGDEELPEVRLATSYMSEDDPKRILLHELTGKAYDDPLWDEYLSQWTFDELSKIVCGSGYSARGSALHGLPEMLHMDGPQGLHTTFGELQNWFMYPCEVTVASTWNTALATRMGEAVGTEAHQVDCVAWYGPAMNIHRSPIAGRNFEYYSEDGKLSSEFAAATVAGANSEGLITYIKHFVLNDQETNRREIITWCNEQALREIYLKPFEGGVKAGKSVGVMTSFNRIGCMWTGACYELLTEVLRDEWGFSGVVITDYFDGIGYMNPMQGIRAGNDTYLNGGGAAKHLLSDYRTNPKATGYYTYQSAKRLLYSVANSKIAMKNIDTLSTNDSISVTLTIILVWNIAVSVVGAGCLLYVLLKFIKKHK